MHAVVVEAVPARALGALAIAGEIGLPETLVHEVVLARDVMHVELDLADDLIGIVELVGLGKMGDVAGMSHEGRLGRHRLHLGDGLAQRAECIRLWLSPICRKVKPADSAAKASPSRPKDFGIPPDNVHNTPVPA
jgi:hypothetical protein